MRISRDLAGNRPRPVCNARNGHLSTISTRHQIPLLSHNPRRSPGCRLLAGVGVFIGPRHSGDPGASMTPKGARPLCSAAAPPDRSQRSRRPSHPALPGPSPARVWRAVADQRRRVPPCEAGDSAEGDGGQVGDGTVEQHGGGHLRAGPVAGGGDQGADQSEFGDSEAAGGDGQHRSAAGRTRRRRGRSARKPGPGTGPRRAGRPAGRATR